MYPRTKDQNLDYVSKPFISVFYLQQMDEKLIGSSNFIFVGMTKKFENILTD